jgi:hypothetical protein
MNMAAIAGAMRNPLRARGSHRQQWRARRGQDHVGRLWQPLSLSSEPRPHLDAALPRMAKTQTALLRQLNANPSCATVQIRAIDTTLPPWRVHTGRFIDTAQNIPSGSRRFPRTGRCHTTPGKPFNGTSASPRNRHISPEARAASDILGTKVSIALLLKERRAGRVRVGLAKLAPRCCHWRPEMAHDRPRGWSFHGGSNKAARPGNVGSRAIRCVR